MSSLANVSPFGVCLLGFGLRLSLMLFIEGTSSPPQYSPWCLINLRNVARVLTFALVSFTSDVVARLTVLFKFNF